ncbi:MAG: exopolyphosphatase, partial [Mycobacteriaceae bacterium]
AQLMTEAGVSHLRMVATSATRDASNREDFFSMTREVLGMVLPGAQAEVISGDEEARLSFAGAIGDLDPSQGPFVVVDLGGGSTELVLGSVEDGVFAAFSADVGCVRVTERFLHSDPPTDAEVAAAQNFAAEKLAQAFAAVPVEHARTWVGVAGSMTTLAALALNLDVYDAEVIHLSRMSFDTVYEVSTKLREMTRAQRAELGPMHPGRVDVIGGGSVVTAELAQQIEQRSPIRELVVSEHDILDGIALSIR